MPIPSLLDMAQSACKRYVRNIEDFGETPYRLIAPIIDKVEHPEQLHKIESNSPQIVGKTSHIWRRFIERDIARGLDLLAQFNDGKGRPNDPANWFRLYKKLKRDVEEKEQRRLDLLTKTVEGMQKEKEECKATVSNRYHEKGAIVARSRSAGNMFGGGGFRGAGTFGGGSTGVGGSRYSSHVPKPPAKTILQKIQREQESAKARKIRRPILKHGTTGRSGNTVSRLREAPVALVEEMREQKKREAGLIAVPRPTKVMRVGPGTMVGESTLKRKRETGYEQYDLLNDREARLRDMKSGGSRQLPPAPTLTEDYLEGDDDDLFDESDEAPTRTVSSSQQAATLVRTTHQPRISIPQGSPAPGRSKRRSPPRMFHSPAKKVL